MSSEKYQPFPNTHWSLVRRAGTGESQTRREALAALLERYQPALRSYLRVVRRQGEDVDDILQAFVADKFLEREMLRHADEGRGRFRTFLLTSLNNYVSSWHRSDSKALRSGAADSAHVPEEKFAREQPRAGEGSPAAELEAAWARTLVRNVLEAMRNHCLADGRSDVWAVFEGRVLAELFEDQEPVPYEKLAESLGLGSPTQAANLLVTGKRLYARLLRVAVSEYERGDADVEAEIAELRAILGRARAAGPEG